MVEEFGVLHTWPIWLILAVAVLAVPLLALAERRRQRLLLRLAPYLGASVNVGRRSLLLPVLLLLVISLALLRPYYGFEELSVPRRGQDLMAVVDVSLSMRAADVSPSRLGLAKRKLLDLLALLEAQRRTDRVGIVLFAGASFLYLPLTSDYAVARLFVRNISTELVTAQGSALPEALRAAAEGLAAANSSAPAILLLTDGEDLRRAPADDVSLNGSPVPIYALGIGTPEGAPIPLPDGRSLHDDRGERVTSKLDETLLQQYARESGGWYRRAALTDEDLITVVRGTAHRSEGDGSQAEVIRSYHEYGPLLALVALALLGALFSNARRVLPLLALCALGSADALADSPRAETIIDRPSRPLAAASEAYRRGDFAQAHEEFARHLQQHPQDEEVRRTLAATLYRLGRYSEAAEEYAKLSESTKDPAVQFEAHYNHGNAHFKSGDYRRALEAYEAALKMAPNDPDALHNYELTKHLLEQQQQEHSDSEGSQSESPQDPSGEQQEGSERSDRTEQGAGSDPTAEQESQGTQGDREQQQSSPSEGSTADDVDRNPPQDSQSQGLPPPASADGNHAPPSPDGGEAQETRSGGTMSRQAEDGPALSRSEAEAWLDSLPETSLLLRRKVGPSVNSEQRW